MATGGNPGLASGTNNSAIVLVAALGQCGNITVNTFVNIDEVTTVAAAYALAPYATSAKNVGASTADTPSLAAAFTLASQFADNTRGTSPGSGVPAGTAVPTVTINTLADILASCINSGGGVSGDSSPCGNLFSMTIPPGITAAATDTFTAAVHLAWYPTLNTAGLFNLLVPNGPFQNVLTSVPMDFSLGNGVSSGLSASVEQLTFAVTETGVVSAAQNVVLTNTSANAISISSVGLNGFSAASFSQTNNCPAMLTSGANCTVPVSFAPLGTGLAVAQLSVTNSAANSPMVVGLSGTGSPPVAAQLVSTSPASLLVGSPNTTVTLTGSGFTQFSTVYFAGFAQATTYISPQSVSFIAPSQYLAYVGMQSLYVRNSGFISNILAFPIVNATPTLTSINPATIEAGASNFALTFTGTGISSNTTAMVNGISHTISFYSSTSGSIYMTPTEVAAAGSLPVTLVNPTPGGGTSAALSLNVLAGDNRIRTLSYITNDIVTDPARTLLYASVVSGSLTSPNSVISINPLTGAVVGTQAVSSQPGRLAVSGDGSYLYVAEGTSISRFVLPGLTPDISWSVGLSVEDLQVAPGLPHTLAVAANAASGLYGEILIYDDNVARTVVAQGSYAVASFDTLAWGNDATTLYATDRQFSGGPEYVFSVNQSGPTLQQTDGSAFGGFVSRLTYNATTGLLYDGYGNAVTASTGNSAGVFSVNNSLSYEANPFAIDSLHARAFYLNANAFSPAVVDIQAFNLSQYSFIDSLTVAGLSGSKIVQWGTSGLAVGGGSQIFLIDGPFVSPTGVTSPTGGYAVETSTITSVSPQNVEAGSGATNVTLTGINFTAAAEVTWNGQAIPAVWQSSTQIVATIPASLLTTAVTAAFTVTNGPGTENSNGVAFAVLPDLGPNTQVTAIDVSGQDMVWDSTRNLLYVALTDSAAPNGNSIVAVDPTAAAIQSVTYTGNQPGVLAISSDNAFVYAGFQTVAQIERYTVPGFATNLTIPMNSGIAGESFAGDIKVAPGAPQTIAVTMGSKSIEPRNAGGLAIFDNAVERRGALPYTQANVLKLAWGADTTHLYGNPDPEITPQSFQAFTLGASSIAPVYGQTSISEVGLRPHYDPTTNLIYTDDGGIANPDGTANGFFEFGALMVPDPVLNRAFILHENSLTSYQLDIYDLRRQTYLKTIQVPAFAGYPAQMVRWGSQGLAILTDTVGSGVGMLYLLQGSDISGLTIPPSGAISLTPASVLVGTSAGATITVNGTGFTAGSTVLVNGTARATTFVSSTQLAFQLMAADQGFANYLTVEVSSAPGGAPASPAASLGVLNPFPTIASISPALVLQNAGNVNVTLTGTGFIPSTVVSIGGSARTTTYLSPTRVVVAINSLDIATAGYYALIATNGGPGGGTSASVTLESDNGVPTLNASVSTTLAVGTTQRSIFITGTNFVTGTVVMVNGTPRVTTYQASNDLQVLLTTADVSSPGTLTISAVNPTPGGGSSNAETITLSTGFPSVFSFSPSAAVQGTSTPTIITVNGANFMTGSYVQINGTNRTTTYISSTQLTFALTVADQATVTTLYPFVFNPGLTNGDSYAQLPVVAGSTTSTPAISSVSPTSFVVGSAATTIEVLGSGFGPTSQVLWNGTLLASPYYVNSSYLSVTVPASLLTVTGSATVTVNNVAAATPQSNAVQISIVNPPSPALTSVSPANGPIAVGFTLTVNGTGFTANTAVSFNGNALSTTMVTSTQLTAVIPAVDVVPGNLNITVTTPAPGGGTSAPLFFMAYIPLVNNSMVYNPVNELYYLSIPSSAGEPYANAVVSLDPVTGNLGTPIPVGSEPDQLALSSDGTTLWVGLDGASAVRQVNLTTNTAALQFALPATASNSSPLTVTAMVVVPGQNNSVVVTAANQSYNSSLAIYDSGIVRGSVLSSGYDALQINGTLGEIYAGSGQSYAVYTYNSLGITRKISAVTSGLLSPYVGYPIQYSNGFIYDDYSTVLNAETGALVGNLGSTATNTPALLAVDAAQGLAFQLNTPQQYSQLPTQIQVFNLSTLAAGSSIIPISLASTNNYSPVATQMQISRWGVNGLAFRNSVSVYALRSNLVKDLSATPADLAVSLVASGPNLTGTQTTYVATVSNAGPSAATEVLLTAQIPATGVIVSATPSVGTCSAGTNINCNLGSISSGAQATVTLIVNQLSPGTATMSASVSSSETDANLANNVATSTAAITGATYSVAPTVGSITPSTVLAGSSSTAITVSGTGFGYGTTVLMDGAALPTSIVSTTQVMATVPGTSLASLGWHAISVSNPTPGGGASTVLPLSVYSAIKAGASHIVFEPFSQTILATLQSSMPLGNSVGRLTPSTGTINTPIPVGSEPTHMGLSDDGQILYVYDSGSSEIVRLNLLTQQIEASILAPSGTLFAVQPGSENTITYSLGVQPGMGLIDFNASTHSATPRSSTSGAYTSGFPRFLNASTLLVSGGAPTGGATESFASYAANTSGLASAASSFFPADPGAFRVANGIAYTGLGAMVDVTDQPNRTLGTFPYPNTSNTEGTVAPDPAIGRVFYLTALGDTLALAEQSSSLNFGIAAFNTMTFALDNFLPLDINAIDGTGQYPYYTPMDIVRWGQDGIAALTNSGTIYLIRGPAVVPQLLQIDTPAVLSTSTLTLQHGFGNTPITLTGSNFLPGVAALWNGSYRTTVLVNANQVTVDIPASDLTSVGSATVVIMNPGAPASGAASVTIN